jgi:hypothetical protein
VAVTFTNFYQELSVVLFFQFQVLLFIFRVSEVFRKLLNLRKQALKCIQNYFRLALSKVIFLLRAFNHSTSWSCYRISRDLTNS